MRAAITPALALTAVLAAALAPRVFGAATFAALANVDVQEPQVASLKGAPDVQPTDLGGAAVTVQLDRRAAMAGGTLRAELTITTPTSDAEPVQLPTDVLLVLDTSGSMGGTKIADARRAADALMAQLGREDRVAIVTFDSSARVVRGLAPVDGEAYRRVGGLTAGGGTEMVAGLAEAQRLLDAPDTGRARRVVLLSDGLPNHTNGLHELARDFAARESPLSTVGIGADYDPMLMQALADGGTGNFYWAGPDMALDAVFADEFRAARARFASGTTLSSHLAEGAVLTGVSGYGLEGGQVALGDLYAGQQRTLFVDVQVPMADGEVDLGSLQLSWTDGSGQRVEASVSLGTVELTRDATVVAANLDAGVWGKAVVQEEYNSVRKQVSAALAGGRRDEAQKALQAYQVKNRALNDVVGSTLVESNLAEVEQLQQQIEQGAVDKQGVVEMATKSYQLRRSGQSLAY